MHQSGKPLDGGLLPRLRRPYWYAILLGVCLLLLSGPAHAAQYQGASRQFQQPDGTRVEVRLFGTELYMRAESLDGYALAVDPSSGWICYAELGDDGGLRSSGIHYLPVTDVDTRQRLAARGIAPGTRASSAKIASIVASTRQSLQGAKDGAGTSEASLDVRAVARYSPRLGAGKGLIVLVDFSDRAGSIPATEYDKAFNGDTYDSLGSIRTWIESISYDKYSASHTVIGYMRASYPTSHYLGGAEFDYSASAELMKQVYAYIDAEIDLTDHATNGFLPSLVVIYPGAEIAKQWATGLWPHAGEAGYTTSEKVRIANIFISNAGSKTPMDLDTYRHELGHSLFGWPDTYDYDSDSAGAGGFATETTLPCAPFRAWSGWLNVIDVVGVNQSYSLVANGDTCLRYKNASNASEFFMVEYMRKDTVKRPDAPDEGLLIWHVDEKGDNSLQDMTPTKHYELSVEQADGLFELEKNSRKRTNDLFHAGNKDRFDDTTTPDSHWWNDTASGFKVCNIGGLDPSMTLTVGCSDGIADAGVGGAIGSGGSSGSGGATGSGGNTGAGGTGGTRDAGRDGTSRDAGGSLRDTGSATGGTGMGGSSGTSGAGGGTGSGSSTAATGGASGSGGRSGLAGAGGASSSGGTGAGGAGSGSATAGSGGSSTQRTGAGGSSGTADSSGQSGCSCAIGQAATNEQPGLLLALMLAGALARAAFKQAKRRPARTK